MDKYVKLLNSIVKLLLVASLFNIVINYNIMKQIDTSALILNTYKKITTK